MTFPLTNLLFLSILNGKIQANGALVWRAIWRTKLLLQLTILRTLFGCCGSLQSCMEPDTPQLNPDGIPSLVAAFQANLRSLRDERTPEAVIRHEYIDILWKLLGWDVANVAHRSSAEKDVVIEATVGTLEGEAVRSRRPDYIFRIDGFSRFVVEAKPPFVDVATDRDAIFQAKTYAWSAQIPFVVLTNFEQFRLFDATIKPYHAEPDRGVISDFDLRFEDYPTQWDVLIDTFSRDAVANASLEELLAKIKRVRKGRRIRGIDRMLIDIRGTEPVDRVFLKHLEDYRLRFARALYEQNQPDFPEAKTRHGAARLTEATQRLIDRLVFMRVCEDRNITPYGELREVVNSASQNQSDLYSELISRFRRFDEEYNGYLFKAHFSELLSMPPELLADFIRSLYPPEGAYRFDAIGDDLLGIIYERFLGRVITVKRNHVEAEEKPEVRHAGGVYYTPRFVVDTIIRRVVAPKIEGKSPLEVLDVKILDPACGSGSFLIAALQYLFDYCLRYVANDPKAAVVAASRRARKRTKKIAFQDKEGQWYLSPIFRSQILACCMHGVDIDAQAVEVTIMSLYLKLLEGRLPPNWQREFLKSRLLPPMDNNIRCGNSLLSQTDFDRFWDNKYGNLFGGDEDVRFRINAFDWKSETRGFGRLFAERKGFDCIIGNPPYIRVQELKKWSPEECEFYRAHYASVAKGNYDIYVVFIDRAMQLLSREGLLGFICPNKFLTKEYAGPLRGLLSQGKHVKEIINFCSNQVFRGSTTYTCIVILRESPPSSQVRAANIHQIDDAQTVCEHIIRSEESLAGKVDILSIPHPESGLPWSLSTSRLRGPLKSLPRLIDVAAIFVGVQTDADDVYYLSTRSVKEESGTVRVFCSFSQKEYDIESGILRDLLQGTNVQSYVIKEPVSKIIFPFVPGPRGRYVVMSAAEMSDRFPLAMKFFADEDIQKRLKERGANKLQESEEYWDFIYRKNLAKQGLPKLCVPRLAEKVCAALDGEGSYCLDNVDVCGVVPSDESLPLTFFLGLLNSRLLDTYMKKTVRDNFRGGYLSLNRQFLGLLPIKLPETDREKLLAGRISERVTKVIQSKKRLLSTRLSQHERTRVEREIEAYESEIDEFVCELYGVKEIPE